MIGIGDEVADGSVVGVEDEIGEGDGEKLFTPSEKLESEQEK